ncbi:hypothetical protein CTI12_AA593710 [Artemisia annua]|uniref:Helitron helicase-like domain-containing protein n=1 Tax=Artemisia annua TaxID=35608 RepID=A0A2U1KK18_ARTAN|nr:hypothetical protein CTI12_AA593710 [Artemisia annua]
MRWCSCSAQQEINTGRLIYRRYELPTAETVDAVVFEETEDSRTDFNIIIEQHSGDPQCVSKLHSSYMSLQFPLLFLHGEDGYHIDLTLAEALTDTDKERKMSMKMHYSYKLTTKSIATICCHEEVAFSNNMLSQLIVL